MKLTFNEKIFKFICYFIATLTALLCLYPLLYSFFVSVCSEKEWVANAGLILWMPFKPTLTAYGKIFGSGSYVLNALWISILRTVIGTFGSLLFTALLGYVVSRHQLPGKKIIMYILVFTILFNGGLIPGFLVVKEMGLYNSFWSMVIPGLLSSFNVLIFKQFFEGIPKELEEAAVIDGAGEFKLMTKIILPMSKPVLSAIGLFTMVGHWNSWFDAMIYIDQSHSQLWPLQLFTMINFNNLNQINSNNQSAINFLLQGQGVMEISTKMALTIVTMLPVLIIYPFFQKHFTKGVYTGAVKG